MQTPGHAMINLAALGALVDPSYGGAILAGAVLPDVPIMILYAREHLWRGVPEEVLWSDHYQRRIWQTLIHGAHSIPLALVGAALGWALNAPLMSLTFISVLLHALADLPVHAEDAHRHFLPFSQWRFVSPLSYWDPRHHAAQVALVELLLVAGASAVLWRGSIRIEAQLAIAAVLAWYLASYGRMFVRRAARRPVS